MKTNLKVITRLLWRMREKYGSHWVMHYNDQDMEAVKNDWLSKLKQFSAEDVGKALHVVTDRYPAEPPDSSQFARLVSECKHCRLGYLSFRSHQTEQITKANPNVASRELQRMGFRKLP